MAPTKRIPWHKLTLPGRVESVTKHLEAQGATRERMNYRTLNDVAASGAQNRVLLAWWSPSRAMPNTKPLPTSTASLIVEVKRRGKPVIHHRADEEGLQEISRKLAATLQRTHDFLYTPKVKRVVPQKK